MLKKYTVKPADSCLLHPRLHNAGHDVLVHFLRDFYALLKKWEASNPLAADDQQHVQRSWKLYPAHHWNIVGGLGDSSVISSVDFDVNGEIFSLEKNLILLEAACFRDVKGNRTFPVPWTS